MSATKACELGFPPSARYRTEAAPAEIRSDAGAAGSAATATTTPEGSAVRAAPMAMRNRAAIRRSCFRLRLRARRCWSKDVVGAFTHPRVQRQHDLACRAVGA